MEIGKVNDQFIIILDVNRVFSEEELTMVQESEELFETETEPEIEAVSA